MIRTRAQLLAGIVLHPCFPRTRFVRLCVLVSRVRGDVELEWAAGQKPELACVRRIEVDELDARTVTVDLYYQHDSKLS